MGDVIHALPVASSIHNAWPETKITWIVDPRWEPLLKGNPAIDRISVESQALCDRSLGIAT